MRGRGDDDGASRNYIGDRIDLRPCPAAGVGGVSGRGVQAESVRVDDRDREGAVSGSVASDALDSDPVSGYQAVSGRSDHDRTGIGRVSDRLARPGQARPKRERDAVSDILKGID